MKAHELIELAYENRLFSDKFFGETPHKTMQARLSEDIVRKGENSVFVRIQPGTFYLRILLSAAHNQQLEIFEAPRREPPPSSENVLVFPAALLEKIGRFQGIKRHWKKIAKIVLNVESTSYLNRMIAEDTDSLKQVLTYILVMRGDKLLSFKRGRYNRAVDFLRGAQCVGFGGHATEADLTVFDPGYMGLRANAARELREELHLPRKDLVRLDNGEGLEVVGVLNDDSSAVGKRHFAFILRYEVSDDPSWDTPERGESSITQLRWIDLSSPQLQLRNFEYWSQLCLREFFSDVVKARPSYRIIRKRPFKTPHILCIVGNIGSGKSLVTDVLVRHFRYHEVNGGRVLARLLQIPPLPDTPRDAFQKRAWKFIACEKGPTRLGEAIWSEIRSCDAAKIVVDGIRQIATFEALKQLSTNNRVALLFVHTPPDLAYELFVKREPSYPMIEDFVRLLAARVEEEVPRFLNLADAVLYNWVGEAAFIRSIKEMMKELAGS